LDGETWRVDQIPRAALSIFTNSKRDIYVSFEEKRKKKRARAFPKRTKQI
jgi:hypothetical protein